MKRFISVLLLFVLFSQELPSQTVYFPQWDKEWICNSSFYNSEYIIDNNGKNHIFLGALSSSGYDFDPGPGTYPLSSISGGVLTGIIYKLDSIGNFQWAKKFYGSQNLEIHDMVVDKNDNIYFILNYNYNGVIDVDPGPGVININIFSSSPEDIIVSLDKNGNYRWHIQLTYGSNSIVYDIMKTDKRDQITVLGSCASTIDLDPGPSTTTVQSGGFCVKFDTSGNFVWGRSLALNIGIMDFDFDSKNNFLCAGIYSPWADDFDAGPATYSLIPLPMNSNCFIMKTDSVFNLTWANGYHGRNYVTPIKIKVDSAGNSFVMGQVSSSPYYQFYPKYNDTTTLFNAGVKSFDGYTNKYDKNGNYITTLWLKNLKPYDSDIGLDGQFYIAGYIDGGTDFDPSPTTYSLTGAGNGDAFMAIYGNNLNFKYAYKYTNLPLPDDSQIANFIRTWDSNTLFLLVLQGGNVNYGTPLNSYGINGSITALIKFRLQNLSATNVAGLNKEHSFVVYPNPNNGVFTIASDKLIYQIEIKNVLGQTIYSTKPNQTIENVDLSFLSKEIYFVKVIAENKTFIQKVVID